MKGILKTLLVVLIAGVLSTLAINAGDNWGNFENSFLAAALPGLASDPCPDNMVFIGTEMGGFCIDTYEASAGEDCFYREPVNTIETQQNVNQSGCKAVSEKEKVPWTYIAQHQAAILCANADKRLPTAQEWYRAVLGTPDAGSDVCNTHDIKSGKPELTGERALCISARGVYDMIGNVWEWVDETVVDGKMNEKELPPQGYVAAVDTSGIPTETTGEPNLSFSGDYHWMDADGEKGVFRGGYWGLEGRAGQYTFHAGVPSTFTGNAVGFRCVADPR